MVAAQRSGVRSQAIAMGGGLDLVTPALNTPPSRCIASANYESSANGYRRFRGYERMDGQTAPSSASYWVLNFNTGTAAVAAGATVTGLTSGATAVAMYDAVVSAGTYGGGDAAGYLVLRTMVGDFVDAESVQVGGVTKSTSSGAAIENGAQDDTNNTTWSRAAQEAARTAIQQVPGTGRITGVWVYGAERYAFREDLPTVPTVTRMYRATTAGWELQTLGSYLAFTSGGVYTILPGDTIVGATSGAYAVVDRLVVTDVLDWALGTATGTLYLRSVTGAFVAENLNVGANLNVATIAGNATANVLLPGGDFEFINHNFYGDSGDECAYFCDGVNDAYEWNGRVLAPVVTGISSISKPLHIGVNRDRLSLAFPSGMIELSQIGEPLLWDGADGAAEFGVGAEITGLLGDVAGALIIFCRNKITILYGADATDFELRPLTIDAGAVARSVQVMGKTIFCDDRGLRSLQTVQEYGNFRTGHLTQLVEPLLERNRRNGVAVTASMRVRRLDLYRLFFDDGSALSIYFGNKAPEVMPLDLGLTVNYCCSGEDSDGTEILFFASDDGYVYQMDAGTSFDGATLRGYMRLAFNASGSPNQNKRYKKLTLETDADPRASIALTAAFSYGDPDIPSVQQQSFTVRGGGGVWDESNWDEVNWDNPIKGRAEAWIDGIGFNMSPTISTSAIYEEPHTIHGMIVTYSERGMVK